MPRRREVPKRTWAPDPVYHDALVTRLTNKVMVQGKKAVAESIVHQAFATIEERTREDPVKVYRRALENVMPVVEVRARRVGGSTYQVPLEVRPERRVSVGLRWLVDHARSRSGKNMADKLAAELMEASHNRGTAVKKKEDVHRMAEANKAFAHYRW